MTKRVLMYARSKGLGHLRRARNIALAMLALEPECTVLILTDYASTPFFQPVIGIDYLRLPGITRVDRFTYRSETLNVSIEELIKLRADIALQAFSAFKPDVVLVDFYPVGFLGEMKPMLDQVSHMSKPPKLFLGLRGILQDPTVTNAEWREIGAYDYLKLYDAVLVYDCPEIFNTESAYDLTLYARRVVYCNYVVSASEYAPQDEPTDEPLILVIGGSGRDVFPVEKAFLQAMPILTNGMPFRSVIITGPNMLPEDHETLVALATPYPVPVYRSVSDATQLIQKAAVVLTMGGYNSLCEILQFRKKALVVPRITIGALEEQEIRVQLFAERHLIRMLNQTDLSPERLAEELIQLIRADDIPDPANIPPMDGAQRVAALLLGQEDLSQ